MVKAIANPIIGIDRSPRNIVQRLPIDSEATAQGTSDIDRAMVVAANTQLIVVSLTLK